MESNEIEGVVAKVFKKNEDLLDLPQFYCDKVKEWLNKSSCKCNVIFADEILVVGSSRLDRKSLTAFFAMVGKKMRGAKAEPGTSVGALAAQSIGEPCTQMTLKVNLYGSRA